MRKIPSGTESAQPLRVKMALMSLPPIPALPASEQEFQMTIGPIEAVRVFTTKLAEARRFYADTLGLQEKLATSAISMFDTGQAKLIVECVDPDDPEAAGLVGRFTAFSFTVTNMDTALNNLRDRSIQWLGPPERQAWGGLLAHFKDPDGNVLTLVEYL